MSVDIERERWEKYRRLLIAIIALIRDEEAGNKFTLRVEVVPREQK